jgi:hypothetical protein
MAKYEMPDMDSVITKTELMEYFRALKRFFGDVARHLATDVGQLKSILKAQDRRQGTTAAAYCIRPLLWVGATFSYGVQRAVAATAQRIYNNYSPNNKPRPKRDEIDWDK